MSLPIAITMGDGAGIGPEIIAKYFAAGTIRDLVVIGDPARLDAAFRTVGTIRGIVASPGEQGLKPIRKMLAEGGDDSLVPVLDIGRLPADLPYGRVEAACGRLAYDAITTAIDLALAGEIGALVTAPIHKEALHAAGVPFPGHTEILADRTGTKDFGMMLIEGPLRVILVSIHLSLRAALDKVTPDNLARTFRLAQEGCRALGIEKPRIAVAGLNPHAGEGGLFGREEIEIISPAIKKARRHGLDISGPYPPDTVFMRARRGEFDIVVAQYHDQGLIPIKLNGVEKGVNITVGLPIIRTSVDHGTAFDVAGKGVADPSSLAEAVHVARAMMAAKAVRK
ncbi:MAG TPA: 4-hydroxythreonine-4-phosphate dehydrogenase PdxA [Rhabdaerophilum sp.]|nr:4-hydroxythreonine-4-phosphate dehydrogenase PdxA [Rhabdaerophilum sp.]